PPRPLEIGNPERDQADSLLHVPSSYAVEPGFARLHSPPLLGETRNPRKSSWPAKRAGLPRMMRWRGLEPPRGLNPTRPSTLRVYQFRHQRAAAIVAARYGDRSTSPSEAD